MSIKDTKLCLPEIKIPAGYLLSTGLLGVWLNVPAEDIVLQPETCIDLSGLLDILIKILDGMAEEFYKRIGGE